MNHPLWEHCEKHFKEFNCENGETPNGQASHLVLCLSRAVADGKTLGLIFVFIDSITQSLLYQ